MHHYELVWTNGQTYNIIINSRSLGIGFMKSCVYIMMAVVLALASVPHLVCACGCSFAKATDVAARPSPPRCPHCPADDSSQTPQRPHPCGCGNCDRVLAAVPGPAAAVVAAVDETCLRILPNAASVEPASQQASTESRLTGPPGLSSHPSRSIPILLGHLLL